MCGAAVDTLIFDHRVSKSDAMVLGSPSQHFELSKVSGSEENNQQVRRRRNVESTKNEGDDGVLHDSMTCNVLQATLTPHTYKSRLSKSSAHEPC